MKKKKVLNSAIVQREKNNEILITSIIIAFGINVFSTGVLGFLNIETEYSILIVVGSIFSIIVFLTYQFCKIKKENATIEIGGLIIHNRENNRLVSIPEYGISYDIKKYMESAFSENKALENRWNKGKIGTDTKKTRENNNYMIVELIEYIFLDKLTISLEDYYNINHIHNNDIRRLNFEEMPSMLRKNIFLKLFSEEMENREAFISQNNKNNFSEGRVVYAIGKKGAIFNRFELNLPKEVKIKKEKENEIEFDMKYFTLKVEFIFDGFNTSVESEFYEEYLNIMYNPIKYNDLDFKIKLNVKFKPSILFTNRKIENYMWIDNLLNGLIEYADIDAFYNRINWEATKCIMRCLKK